MRETEPTTIVKGERIEWTKSYSGFPADEFDLEYRFRGAGGGVNVAATADGNSFVAELTADLSDNVTVTGKHRWQAWLTETADATNTFVIDEGTVEVKTGFSSASLAATSPPPAATATWPSFLAACAATASSATAATAGRSTPWIPRTG